MSGLGEARVRELAALIGEHTPVYDYRSGHFTMECEACDFRLYGIDRAEAKRRFGEHFAALTAPLVAGWLAEERERIAAAIEAAEVEVAQSIGRERGSRVAGLAQAAYIARGDA